MPEDLIEDYDYPEVTQGMKEKILGKNALKLLDKDPEQIKKEIKGDNWDQLRQEREESGDYSAEPWSTYEAGSALASDD